MNSEHSQRDFDTFFQGVSSPLAEELRSFRSLYPERALSAGGGVWRYRAIGSDGPVVLLLPGGELVNDLGFQFATAMSRAPCRIVYPGYPRVSSIEELADGLIAILDAEGIVCAAILGASFGGSVAQVLVRRHPERINAMVLSNTGVPLRQLIPPVWIVLIAAKVMPWSALGRLLTAPLLRVLNASETDSGFWRAYFEELFSARLSKADVVANVRQQLAYHRRFRFTPRDLADWEGRVLIAESDTDVIGPSRRRALRQTYPKAKLYSFHNAGHAPVFSRPDEYLAMVADFLGCQAEPGR